MPLRIVFDARHIRDFGIGTYISNLLRALAETDRENHYTLTVLPDDRDEIAGLPPNFEAAEYPHRDTERFEHLRYAMFVRRFAPNLIHLPLNIVPALLPKPYVVTIHDMSSLLFERRGRGRGWRENFGLYTFRRGLLRADRVIAVSDSTKRDVENVLGIPSERIELVYSAPDPRFCDLSDITEEKRRQTLARYQITYPFLLYAGRIRPHKNVPRLIESFAVVRGELENHPQYSDLRLIVIGDEITRHPEVRRAMVQTRMQNAVRFLGFVPFDTLRVFYSTAAAFIFPSLYEGFGLAPLEAMATGTPVVTTGVSSLPESVGDAAVIVNPENVFDMAKGIREVLLDATLRGELIRRGHDQVQRFSWKRTAGEVLRVYRETAR